MKLSIILAASVTADKFHKKEWDVPDAYFAGDDVMLSDPAIRQRFYYSATLNSTFGRNFTNLLLS
jgi:hypothetical protein